MNIGNNGNGNGDGDGNYDLARAADDEDDVSAAANASSITITRNPIPRAMLDVVPPDWGQGVQLESDIVAEDLFGQPPSSLGPSWSAEGSLFNPTHSGVPNVIESPFRAHPEGYWHDAQRDTSSTSMRDPFAIPLPCPTEGGQPVVAPNVEGGQAHPTFDPSYPYFDPQQSLHGTTSLEGEAWPPPDQLPAPTPPPTIMQGYHTQCLPPRAIGLEEMTPPSAYLQQQHPFLGPVIQPSQTTFEVRGTTPLGRGSAAVSGPLGWGSAHHDPFGPGSPTSAGSSSSQPPQRRSSRRPRAASKLSTGVDLTDLDLGLPFEESDADNDSDVYLPSRASSALSVRSPGSSVSFGSSQPAERRGRTKRSSAMTGSEALALVTSRREKERSLEIPNGGFRTGSASSQSNGSGSGSGSGDGNGKRRNASIPLPVPIPNLTKKSRGRKVPYVAPITSAGEFYGSVPVAEGEGVSTGKGRVRRKRGDGGESGKHGGRDFVCPECGKCFIRGEHLKRHVRSIHTHEKREQLSSVFFGLL
ncbi:hypothetical protein AX16_001086 [Volvariella volvacea WC 439]|nr:hypothetical protein AX16_001086 [Volvariella volvacea WC 439]